MRVDEVLGHVFAESYATGQWNQLPEFLVGQCRLPLSNPC